MGKYSLFQAVRTKVVSLRPGVQNPTGPSVRHSISVTFSVVEGFRNGNVALAFHNLLWKVRIPRFATFQID